MSVPERVSLVVEGLRLRALRLSGARRRLLCLHGFLGRAEAWEEVALRVCEELACEVVMPHLPGHDPDSPAREGESFDRCAARVVTALAAFDSGPWWLAGYSMGARLGLRILLRGEGDWAGGLLIGANPGLAARQQEERRETERGWQRQLRREGLPAFLRAWESLPLFRSQRKAAPARRLAQQRLRRRLRGHEVAAALDTLGLGVMPSGWDELDALDLPLHLLVGEDDAKFTALTNEMVRRLPRATSLSVPGAGHNLLLEAPDSVVRALKEMLR